MGTVINQVGFDALYVQFYNNWCGLQNYNNANVRRVFVGLTTR
jgi:chitinase